MVSYIQTPSTSPRRVSFMPIPIYSRPAHDDELYVMNAFERHASHCPSCLDPQRTHRKGGTLCAKGHAKAADVAEYVYNKKGLAYSLVDRSSEQRVRLELPTSGLDSVRSLLSAFEEGMQLLQVVKREPRRSSMSAAVDKDFVLSMPSPEIRRTVRKNGSNVTRKHRRTASNDSSDYDIDYRRYAAPASPVADTYYVEPETYVPKRRQPVFYRVVTPTSPTQPIVIYPR